MKTSLFLAAVSVAFVAVLGIAGKKASASGHAYLELTLQNETGEEIDQASIVLDKNRCTSGILGKGASKTYLGWQKPVGTNAVIQWRDGRQAKREASVSLVNIYKSSRDGRLVFSIMPPNSLTNVLVRFEAIDRRPKR